MKPRLAEIADYSGVSQATVSRVLNDKPGVSAATRQAVLTAVDVLGYDRPSRLRHKSAGLVGLIVPELTNPIFPAFAQQIETALSAAGYTAVLCTQTTGGVHEDEYVQMLLDRAVSGIVFVSGQHADTSTDLLRYLELRKRGLPMVLVNGYREGLDAPFLSTDDGAAVQLAMRHLAHLGHTRIGLAVGQQRYVPVVRRIAAYREVVRQLGGEELIEGSLFTVEGGGSAATALLDRGATAIVAGSDLMALGAIRAARQRGLEVPDDVSVVGYDDSPLVAFTDPPLTTVRQDVRAMSDAVVHALLDEIAGNRAARSEYLFRPELIVRGSTDAPSGEAGPGRSEPAHGDSRAVRRRRTVSSTSRTAPTSGTL